MADADWEHFEREGHLTIKISLSVEEVRRLQNQMDAPTHAN